MKLLLLRCPQCNHALAPGNDDQVVQCPNCRSAVAINEGGLSTLPVQYVRSEVENPPHWLPFWVYRDKVTILERRTQGGRSAEGAAQEFWGQPRQVYIPAWACDLFAARELVEKLLEKQPVMDTITPPEGATFEPAVVTPADGRKLLELVIVTIEAERSDYLENFQFDLQLDSEALWLLPAAREKDEWRMLLKGL